MPALQIRRYPIVQESLLETVDPSRQEPDRESLRVTLYGTAEKGIQRDFLRETLFNLVRIIQENRWDNLDMP
ncbi:hypothetical protein [Acidithiobacillus thiooxidans]|uniref:Uncharacterized protein n=1 Tax=Acidithiobacillus thiooxidans TaxID=930 RepID=A0A1C2IEH1_ACITH|nr:hypothetical protein [Acidithiobacillus thiooxidans]OCX74381.1 hypothetical protein A6M23_06235 [Acidithiobacillus thiooxidans]OCX86867.1 hypothetical protein A6P08_04725 [Acidithiobacillus thiooxidans]